MKLVKEKTMSDTGTALLGHTVRLAEGRNRFSTHWKPREMTVADFVAKITEGHRTHETVAEFHSMGKAQQDDIKDIGGYVGGALKGGRRSVSTIQNRTIITLDLDHAGKEKTETVLDRIEEGLGRYAYVVHSTHKHRSTAPRLRIILFLNKPCFPDEYQAIARQLANKVGIELFDDSTYQPHRLMYWPSTPKDGEYICVDHTVDADGNGHDLVDRLGVLAEYGEDDAWKDTAQWPVSSRETGRLEREIRKAADPLTKKGVIGAFCRVYDVPGAIEAFLGDEYRHEGGNRWTYIEGTSAKGLLTYDSGKFAYSHHSTDPAGNQLVNAFDLVRLHKFGSLDVDAKHDTPVNRLKSYVEMVEWAGELKDVKVELLKQVTDQFDVVDGDDGATVEVVDQEWLAKLNVTKDGSIRPTFQNAEIILLNDHKWKEVIWRNDFTSMKERGKGGEEWRNEDTLELRFDLAERYKVDFNDINTTHAIDLRVDSQCYHPVRNYLKGLKWDGVKRVETLWIDYLGEEDNIYVRESAKCWVVAAVARVFSPGYKFDYVPVLYGPQGIRKTTMCRILAVKEEWFGELRTVEPQKAVEAMKGKWIMELGEMDLNNRHEIEQVKSFISGTETTVRLSYRREPGTFKRQCVFIGTTNQREYLKDSTGNRRWWPIDASPEFVEGGKCLDMETLKKNRDQIWAEAVQMYCDIDVTTELSKEANRIAMDRQKTKMPMDEWKGMIEAWLPMRAAKDRYEREWNPVADALQDDKLDTEVRDRVCVPEIWHDCLGQKGTIKRAQSNRIASIMDSLEEWKRTTTTKFGDRFGTQRGWVPTDLFTPF